MLDDISTSRLIARGIDPYNLSESLIYRSLAEAPRHLDKAPSRITLKRLESDEVYGCKAEFIMAYNEVSLDSLPDVCYIENSLNGTRKQCDKQVYLILTTLAKKSFTYNVDRSEAHFSIFRNIVMNSTEPVLTVRSVYNTVSTMVKTTYYERQLIEAIGICLFSGSEAVLEWLRLVDPSGYYQAAIQLGRDFIQQNCKLAKDVKPFLSKIYNVAKEDKEFMEQLYSPGTNRYLTPVIYALWDTHPEVLKPGTEKGGFAP